MRSRIAAMLAPILDMCSANCGGRHLVALGHAADDAVDLVVGGDDRQLLGLLQLEALLDELLERLLARGRHVLFLDLRL